ncbi:hypothetical protein CEXT_490391 [Caerostris extrusa]|uniref:Uncharacterized protein n=1 Tax=Caerostris extrusa TaxID=172846 RepID=A0AAV4RG37_CAEEX|nr:hypothetical protein CEXT_490391 [Caerostris extrusa]
MVLNVAKNASMLKISNSMNDASATRSSYSAGLSYSYDCNKAGVQFLQPPCHVTDVLDLVKPSSRHDERKGLPTLNA